MARNSTHYWWSMKARGMCSSLILFVPARWKGLCAGLLTTELGPASPWVKKLSHFSVALTTGGQRPQQERCTTSTQHINRAPLNGTLRAPVNWRDWPPGGLHTYSNIKTMTPHLSSQETQGALRTDKSRSVTNTRFPQPLIPPIELRSSFNCSLCSV